MKFKKRFLLKKKHISNVLCMIVMKFIEVLSNLKLFKILLQKKFDYFIENCEFNLIILKAVSYEDIKSAEATIKGTSNTSGNTSLSQQSSIIETPTTPNDSFNLTLSPLTNLSTTNVITNSLSNPPSAQIAPIHGVSSLSSLFGESIKQTPSPVSTSSNVPVTSTQRQTSLTSSQTESTPTTQNPAEQTDKDVIIANDIETDKLLNVIEKSKGFSDSKSTTAIRRQRNRLAHLVTLTLPLYNYNINFYYYQIWQSSSSFDENSSTNANGKKINKLIWNQDRLEVEYRDKEEELKASQGSGLSESASSSSISSLANNNSSSVLNQMNRQSTSSSPSNILRRQNSGTLIDVKILTF